MTITFRLLKRSFLLSGLFAALSGSVSAQGNPDVYDLYVYNGEARPVAGAEVDLSGCGAGVQRTANDGTLHFSVASGAGCYVTIRKFSMQEAVVSVARSGPHQISLAMTADRSGTFTGVLVDQSANSPLSGAIVYARSNISNHWTKPLPMQPVSTHYDLIHGRNTWLLTPEVATAMNNDWSGQNGNYARKLYSVGLVCKQETPDY